MPETNLDILNAVIEGKEKLNIDALNILAQACAEKAGTTSAGPFKYNLDALREIATNIKNIDGGGGEDDPEPEPGGDKWFDIVVGLVGRYETFEAILDDPAFTVIGESAFFGCQNVTKIHAPFVTYVDGFQPFYLITGCKKLLLPALTGKKGSSALNGPQGSQMEVLDVGKLSKIDELRNYGSLKALILRKSNSLVTVDGKFSFTGTSIDNGGSGCTIYIPKVFYDHLGDGSSLDYKAATNWSLFDSYGTITWAQIEGSEFESYD